MSISHPCDVGCTELWHLTGYDPKKIIGSGCGLDSARLRTEISKQIGISPKSIDAYMIGEHGFSQIGAFKAATIAGKKLSELEAENPEKYAFDHMQIEELARKGGYVTYAGKQCTATTSPSLIGGTRQPGTPSSRETRLTRRAAS